MNNSLAQKYGSITAILGGQWGDEGKGKFIDIMAEEYNVIARATGGANAGHTVYVPNPQDPANPHKHIFHLLPSGLLYPHTIGVIGNGCVLHLPTLLQEIETLKENNIDLEGRLFISDRAHLVFEYHKKLDELQEERKGKHKVGTTKRGIGPAYTDKIGRSGIRIHELLDFERFEQKLRANVAMIEELYGQKLTGLEKEIDYYQNTMLPAFKPMITDTMHYLHQAHSEGKNILVEGANGALLDIDHGTYPFVTSSNASIGGTMTGTGINPRQYTSIIGAMKAYCTRVGAGPFPTEQDNETGDKLRNNGGEFGSTTGRPRRCGWFDAVTSRYSAQLNGLTSINLTKLDVLDNFETIKIGIGYNYKGQKLSSFPASTEVLANLEVDYLEMPGWQQDISNIKAIKDLPQNAQNYINKLQELLDVPIESVGVGIRRDQIAMTE